MARLPLHPYNSLSLLMQICFESFVNEKIKDFPLPYINPLPYFQLLSANPPKISWFDDFMTTIVYS